MKVELALLSLILIVSCSAQQYELKCTEKEKDILWPIYANNALYIRCAEIGKALEMKCNAGTVFTFVYQGCVLPDDYIPPPPVDSLPLDGTAVTPSPAETTVSTKPPFTLPTPQHPPSSSSQPPTEKPTTQSTTTEANTTSSKSPPTAPGPPTGSPTAPPTGSPPAPPTGSPPGPPTSGPPGPPTPSRPTAGPGVPGPPSPPATGVPMPNTPAPTPPVIDNSPPSVGITLPSNSEN